MPFTELKPWSAAIGLGLLWPCVAMADLPDVVTDIAISGSLVQMVMGDLGQATVLLPPGADAHDYQLRPSQARAVQQADLQVWVGPQLSPWMERAQASLGQGRPSLTLLQVPGTNLLHYENDSQPDDHDHDHDHDHGTIDPHAWLDPANARIWLIAIADQLAEIDPENAQTYLHNAKAASQSIAGLQTELTQKLAPYHDSHFVVQHDAYAYFTKSFGLNDAIAVALSDASRPSAARLRQIGQDLTAQNASCAFPEVNHDDRLLRAAIEGSVVRLGASLDPEGSAIPQGEGLYMAVLQNLTDNLHDCLGN